jgi:hypothetical protein
MTFQHQMPREILEAIQYAIEIGQEPSSILADESIISEAVREYLASNPDPSPEHDALIAMLVALDDDGSQMGPT